MEFAWTAVILEKNVVSALGGKRALDPKGFFFLLGYAENARALNEWT